MHCQVETYSGFRLHERPRRFTCGDDPREVRHVLRQWLDPDGLCFGVAADDGYTYLLKYHQELDTWEARRLASVNF